MVTSVSPVDSSAACLGPGCAGCLGAVRGTGSGGGRRGRSVGGAEEAANGVSDVQVVREGGGLVRRPRVEPDEDAVVAAAVGVIHPDGDLARRGAVAVGQHLVVDTK